jgi:hypothetical protein
VMVNVEADCRDSLSLEREMQCRRHADSMLLARSCARGEVNLIPTDRT